MASAPKRAPSIITLIILTGLSTLSMHLFIPSLPAMTVFFETEYRIMQLSVALFLGLNGAAQLIIGPLSDRYGRRPVLIWGLWIYVLGSVGCLIAPDITTFMIFRAVQVGAVVALVLGRAIIRDLYDQDQAASMIGYVTMGMAVVPMLAPMLGGFIDQTLGWKANFWVLLITGFAMVALVWVDVGETNTNPSKSFGKQFRDYPELMTSPRFWGYSLSAGFSAGLYFSFLGGAPFVGSEIFGLAPAELGLFFGLPSLGYFLGNFVSGRWSRKVGINMMILCGALVAIAGVILSLALFLAGAGTPFLFFGCMTFVGLGNGMVLPNAISGSLSVRPHLAGTASGLGGALLLGGGAGLSALAGSLLGPGSGPYPLLYMQILVGLLGIITILLVIRRERRLAELLTED